MGGKCQLFPGQPENQEPALCLLMRLTSFQIRWGWRLLFQSSKVLLTEFRLPSCITHRIKVSTVVCNGFFFPWGGIGKAARGGDGVTIPGSIQETGRWGTEGHV